MDVLATDLAPRGFIGIQKLTRIRFCGDGSKPHETATERRLISVTTSFVGVAKRGRRANLVEPLPWRCQVRRRFRRSLDLRRNGA